MEEELQIDLQTLTSNQGDITHICIRPAMDNIVQVSTVSPQILAATLHVLISYIVHALHEGEKVREEKKGNSSSLSPSLPLSSFPPSPGLGS